MAEEKERSTPKSRIETLSDLIFGLALSIGALTLIGTAPSSFQDLLISILYYAFSFLILISVWYSYTRIMSNVHIETRREVQLNVSLLFLVSIEPFLFNELLSKSLPIQYVSILYGLDLGGLFAILAVFANSVLADKNRPKEVIRYYTILRNAEIAGAAVFFVSLLPIFWTLGITVNHTWIPLRYLLWIAPPFIRFIRRVRRRRQANVSLGAFRDDDYLETNPALLYSFYYS